MRCLCIRRWRYGDTWYWRCWWWWGTVLDVCTMCTGTRGMWSGTYGVEYMHDRQPVARQVLSQLFPYLSEKRMWCDIKWCDESWRGMIPYVELSCYVIWCNMMWYNVRWKRSQCVTICVRLISIKQRSIFSREYNDRSHLRNIHFLISCHSLDSSPQPNINQSINSSHVKWCQVMSCHAWSCYH